MNNAITLNKFLEEYPLAEFKPIAYYDKHLDCIRVIVRDCSITEHRIDDVFTVMEDNRPQQGQQKYVGFTIKGVCHLFDYLGIPLDGVHRVTDILQTMVTQSPKVHFAIITDVILDANQQDLEVDFAQAA